MTGKRVVLFTLALLLPYSSSFIHPFHHKKPSSLSRFVSTFIADKAEEIENDGLLEKVGNTTYKMSLTLCGKKEVRRQISPVLLNFECSLRYVVFLFLNFVYTCGYQLLSQSSFSSGFTTNLLIFIFEDH